MRSLRCHCQCEVQHLSLSDPHLPYILMCPSLVKKWKKTSLCDMGATSDSPRGEVSSCDQLTGVRADSSTPCCPALVETCLASQPWESIPAWREHPSLGWCLLAVPSGFLLGSAGEATVQGAGLCWCSEHTHSPLGNTASSVCFCRLRD